MLFLSFFPEPTLFFKSLTEFINLTQNTLKIIFDTLIELFPLPIRKSLKAKGSIREIVFPIIVKYGPDFDQ